MIMFFLLLSACSGSWIPGSGSMIREKRTVIQDPDNEDYQELVVITLVEDDDGYRCQIFDDQLLIEEELKMSGEEHVHRPTEEELSVIRMECDPETGTRKKRRILDGSNSSSGWNVIFPGTKWCGSGNISKSVDDLGFQYETDSCCREHDLCEDYLIGGETKYNLTNKSAFTSMSCECDDKLYECLLKVKDLTSRLVGHGYFNLFKRPCFVVDYPLTEKCIRNPSDLKSTCLEFERDTSVAKVYQWRSARVFMEPPATEPLDQKSRLSSQRIKTLKKYLPL